MFDELKKYIDSDHFFYEPTDSILETCNAPTDRSGVFVVYGLKNGSVDMVYIGSSGELKEDGTISVRSEGVGGIKDQIVNGHQLGKLPRQISLVIKMKCEKMEALDIYWYITHGSAFTDCPSAIERSLLKIHMKICGRLPKWNNQ